MTKKLFVFDFDGTIVDTRLSIIKTFNETLIGLNKKPLPENEIEKLIGLPLDKIFESIGVSGLDLQIAIQEYCSKYNDIYYKAVMLFPDVIEVLSNLKKQGHVLSIASNKGKEAIEKLLKYLEIEQYFSCVAGEEDVETKKPSPEVVFKIASKLNFNISDVIVIGDTKYDLQMGNAAGTETCAAVYGYDSIENLKKERPTYLINSFKDILEISF